ncbi:MAG: TolC family protein [bacterium]
MRNFSFKTILIGLIFFSGVITYGQEKLSLTEEQAIEIGLKNSNMLHASLMKVLNAQAKLKEANSIRLPSLKLSAGYRRLSAVDPFSITTPLGTFNISPSILDNYSTQLTLLQPLFTGFRLSSNTELNEQLANASNEDYNKDKNELVYNIKNAYWSFFKAEQFKKVMDEIVAQINAHAIDAKNLMNVGMLTENDILKFDVQLSNVMYQQIEAENSVKMASTALCSLLKLPLETKIEIASGVNLVDVKYEELDILLDYAFNHRPEIKSASLRIKASEAGVTLAQSSWYPQVSLYADFYYSKPNQRIMPTRNQFDETWDAGVNLSMNLWDWMTTAHQTEQAEAQLAQAADGLELTKDGVTLEVTQNFLTFNLAKKKTEIAALAIKQATENMRVTTDKFKSGLATSAEMIDSETALLSAKTNYTTSIVDYELAKAKLDKSIGK